MADHLPVLWSGLLVWLHPGSGHRGVHTRNSAAGATQCLTFTLLDNMHLSPVNQCLRDEKNLTFTCFGLSSLSYALIVTSQGSQVRLLPSETI